ncbi:MAG: Biotin synthase [Rickettsia asembonensis]|nr:MAG: Biotin synthase [Rickettsia asembonensis]
MKKWIFDEVKEIFSLPFMELIYQAQTVHHANFDPSKIQISSLLSIKIGSCPENCKFCPQYAHYKTYVKKEPLMQIEEVITAAKRAKEAGSTRFCMGAAWRGLRDEDLKLVCEMIKEIKN